MNKNNSNTKYTKYVLKFEDHELDSIALTIKRLLEMENPPIKKEFNLTIWLWRRWCRLKRFIRFLFRLLIGFFVHTIGTALLVNMECIPTIWESYDYFPFFIDTINLILVICLIILYFIARLLYKILRKLFSQLEYEYYEELKREKEKNWKIKR